MDVKGQGEGLAECEQLSSAAIAVLMRAVRGANSASACPGQSSATSEALVLLQVSWREA